MGKQEIQKLIDDEKPAFDFARMVLTTIALWTILIYVVKTIYEKGPSPALWLLVPVWVTAALFGCFLAVRLNLLTERISTDLLEGASGFPVWVRWPFRVVAGMMPVACAWLLVWALMFPNLLG